MHEAEMPEAAAGASVAQRDEVQRLKDLIGWSWQMLAVQLGWTPSQMDSFKKCKFPIDDTRAGWLAHLAQLHLDNPRPNAPGTPAQAEIQETAMSPHLLSRGEPDSLGRSMVAATIAEAYEDLRENDALSEFERGAARWALGDLAARLNVKDLVIAQLRRVAEPPAAQEVVPRPPPWGSLVGEQSRAGLAGPAAGAIGQAP